MSAWQDCWHHSTDSSWLEWQALAEAATTPLRELVALA